MEKIEIVIGSWGSYNACNEKALGSTWLNLADYEDWAEIEEELKKQGFALDGLDAELFIQDIDGIDCKGLQCDYMHPKKFFEILQEADILQNEYNFKILNAFLEVRNFGDFVTLVDKYGARWCDDIYLYEGADWYDLGYELLTECYDIPDYIADYVDYAGWARDADGYEAYSGGIIEIRE